MYSSTRAASSHHSKEHFFAHEIICTPLMPWNPDEVHEEMAREHR
jgi:hypothetical protein